MSSNDLIELNNLCPESKTVTEFLSDIQNRGKLSFFLIIEKIQVSSTKETPCMVWQNEADTVTSICHLSAAISFLHGLLWAMSGPLPLTRAQAAGQKDLFLFALADKSWCIWGQEIRGGLEDTMN